ncbi:Wzz/FepE/Etk N-terminal domain-containing protein [Pseudomonas sp. zfem005]|uniref:Wzz/FepE/Etk N-terminal domain-containing protein n=1 Tax=Pseudomonas sp. zfem005 TaxID=3078200 RepID=UPI002927B738|nr:Wzz/FepE/Etk N-terminal domain-containing protein [Pseudomonas sp. zfem005]MDU9416731.1 Wzz/FepE/Etk N-terminal domain-containing protein [Pseudomonas sp. zfem005]
MNAPLIQPYRTSNDIEFFVLLKGIWKQRRLVLAITVVSLVLAAVYAFVATPQYKVQSILRPASLKDLDQLNESGFYSITPEASLERVMNALGSYSLRLDYLNSHLELVKDMRKADEPLNQLLDRLNREAFSMIASEVKAAGEPRSYQGISFIYPEGVDGVAITNGLVMAAIDHERKKLQEDMDVLVNNRLSMLQARFSAEKARYDADKASRIAELLESDQLDKALFQDELRALRQQLLTGRQSRIKQLDEAILIAEKLGISKPTTPSAMAESRVGGQGNFVRTEVNNQQNPLYFMGVEALSAERTTLLSRTSDDFVEPKIAKIQTKLSRLENNRQVETLRARKNEDIFFKDIVELSGERAKLESLKAEFALLDFSKLRLVHVDQVASSPEEPVKPQKFLILLCGLVLGLVVGGFIATIRVLVRHAMEPVRQEVSV